MAGTELAQAYVQIIPSAQGIKGSITKVLDGESSTAGENAGQTIGSKIKNAILKAGIGVAITKVISSALSEGAALEQSIGGIETLFKDSSDKMKQYANEAYKTAGISANSYMEQSTSFAASLLSSLEGDTEKAAEAANQAIIDMADNSNKMGTSLESIQNAYQGFAKQNYTMLDNLKLGYGGTKEEMERLLSDAEKLTGVKYDISNLSDVYSAIHAIQENLDITGTTSLEAATTFSGSFASMRAAASNFLGYLALGEDIKPSLQALVDTTYTFLVKNFIPMVGRVVSALPGALGQIAITGLQIGKDLINSISKGFSRNITKFIENALPMIVEFSSKLRENAGEFVDAGLNLISQLAQGIADGIPSLIENVPQIIINFAGVINDNMPKILSVGFDIIQTLIQGLINAIPTLIANIPQIIEAIVAVWQAYDWLKLGKSLIDGIKNGIKNMGESLKQTASDLFNGLKEKITGIFNEIKSNVSSVFNGIKNTATSVWNGIKNAITNPITTAKNTVKTMIDKIKSFFNFKWSLPSIKLPHFSVSGSANPLKWLDEGVPRISVEWYAKAMDKGIILDSPTLFGYQNGNLLAAGEAGSETIVGTNSLLKMITDAVSDTANAARDDTLEYIYQQLLEIYEAIKEGRTLNISGKRLACALAGDMDIELNKIRKNESRR